MTQIKAIGFDFYNTLVPFRYNKEYKEYLNLTSELLNEKIESCTLSNFIDANAKSIDMLMKEKKNKYHEATMERRMELLFKELYNREPSCEEVKLSIDIFVEAHVQASSFLPYLPDLLKDLIKKYKIGIVSNLITTDTIHKMLDRDGLRDLFSVVIISGEVGYIKPHKSLFEKFLKDVQVEAESTVFVGDDLVADVGGASKIGMKTVHVEEFAYTEYKDVDASPDFAIKNLSELPKILNII